MASDEVGKTTPAFLRQVGHETNILNILQQTEKDNVGIFVEWASLRVPNRGAYRRSLSAIHGWQNSVLIAPRAFSPSMVAHVLVCVPIWPMEYSDDKFQLFAVAS